MIFNKAVSENDVLNVLRIQLERDAGTTIPSLREYHNYFGITTEVIEKNNKDILILHPDQLTEELNCLPKLQMDPIKLY